ncbi:hypothetical protein WA158_000376 [Blastocystis sp. Blastoise]
MKAITKVVPTLRQAVTKNSIRCFGTRVESDLIGELNVPDEAYYGVQTLRAVHNYNITGVKLNHFPTFIKAFAMTKKACAIANGRLGLIDDKISKSIQQAADEVISGKFNDQFVVDMIQGGAGTSTNMNCNEVIANRALEIMGHKKGEYQYVSPNDHVNKCQSTNDTYPSSAKLGMAFQHYAFTEEMENLIEALRRKAREFDGVIKMGRTQLQDAVPMTLGQEFDAYARTLESDLPIIKSAVNRFSIVNLGGTAIGTGTAAHPDFSPEVVKALREVTGLPIELADNLIAATSSTGSMTYYHGIVRRVAIKLSQICNDLRLLASGPRCGLHEINLPAMAPGSSIMPGKVNPVIPEVVNQTCFQVIGNDIACTMGSEAGQLELNVMEPVIIYNCYNSVEMMTRALRTLRTLCIDGITANKDRCEELVHNSIGVVTALLPYIGYKNASKCAKIANQTGKSIATVLVEQGCLSAQEVKELLVPEKMIKPNYMSKKN